MPAAKTALQIHITAVRIQIASGRLNDTVLINNKDPVELGKLLYTLPVHPLLHITDLCRVSGIRIQHTLMRPALQLLNIADNKRRSNRPALTAVMGNLQSKRKHRMDNRRVCQVCQRLCRKLRVRCLQVIDKQCIREHCHNRTVILLRQNAVLHNRINNVVRTVIKQSKHRAVTQNIRLDIRNVNRRRLQLQIRLTRKEGDNRQCIHTLRKRISRTEQGTVFRRHQNSSFTRAGISEGRVAVGMPNALSRSILDAASPSPPSTIAPACPMRFSFGAETPAI